MRKRSCYLSNVKYLFFRDNKEEQVDGGKEVVLRVSEGDDDDADATQPPAETNELVYEDSQSLETPGLLKNYKFTEL